MPTLAAQKAGVDVLAAAAGTVARMRDGVADVSVRTTGLAAVQGTECGNGVVVDHGGGWETQYCHMAQGSIRVKAGDQVQAGQPIGRVGLSGQTEYPHLHFTVRKGGVVVDPFDPAMGTSCQASAPLWNAQTLGQLVYKQGAVLNTGFAAAPVQMEAVEAGQIAPPTAASPALLAYVRAIALEAGDVQELTLRAPSGEVLASAPSPALERPRAQHLMFVGKRLTGPAWPHGVYRATYVLKRKGRTALERTFELTL